MKQFLVKLYLLYFDICGEILVLKLSFGFMLAFLGAVIRFIGISGYMEHLIRIKDLLVELCWLCIGEVILSFGV